MRTLKDISRTNWFLVQKEHTSATSYRFVSVDEVVVYIIYIIVIYEKNIDELSHHKSNVKKKLLYFAPTFINLIGKKIK